MWEGLSTAVHFLPYDFNEIERETRARPVYPGAELDSVLHYIFPVGGDLEDVAVVPTFSGATTLPGGLWGIHSFHELATVWGRATDVWETATEWVSGV